MREEAAEGEEIVLRLRDGESEETLVAIVRLSCKSGLTKSFGHLPVNLAVWVRELEVRTNVVTLSLEDL